MDHNSEPATKVSRADARIVRSRAALRSALVDLVGEQPFADIPVAAITTRAGVGYATFFRHYRDKEALLAEIADALIADLIARLAPLVIAGDGMAAMHALVARVEEERPLCRALLTGAGETMRRTITARAVALAAATPAPFPAWLPRSLAIPHIVGATLTILSWWLEEKAAPPAADVAAMLHRLVIAPALEGDD